MSKRPSVLLALSLVVALLAAACGGSSGGGSPESSATSGETVVAVDGGTASVVQPVDATSLDPTTIINAPSQGSAPLSAIYDALFTIDQQTGAIEPRIATDFSSPDGLTWTLTLRPDVKFSDGTPLDAAAVKAQWERISKNPRATASYQLDIVGSMTAVDATTLQVVLTKVNRQFHQLVAWTSMTWIPSPTAVAAAGEDFGNKPVGAGPFVLTRRTPGSETVLAKNPSYYQAGLPKLDSLVIKTIPDPQQASDTLTTGGAQASVSVPDLYAVPLEDEGYTLLSVDQIGGSGWLFGSSRAPFDDIRARKAVYLALDMQALEDTVAGGYGEVPTSLFPEGTPFHNPEITFPEPDPVEAQRLFDELAAEGKPVSFTIVNAGGDSNNKAIGLQTQLAAYDNVDVKVQVLDGASYGTTLFAGDFDLAVYGFAGEDPEPAFASLRTTHPLKIASMGSPQIDAAIQEGREATDVAGRKAAYDKLGDAVNQVYKYIWMNVNKSWAVESPQVTGLTLYTMGTPLFENFGMVG
jgi:peptide/nickel transport system substrate-binding protein